MKIEQMIDHTLLKPDVTASQIERLCEEAKTYGFASVCVNSSFVSMWLSVQSLDSPLARCLRLENAWRQEALCRMARKKWIW